jgi:hypothetical protein
MSSSIPIDFEPLNNLLKFTKKSQAHDFFQKCFVARHTDLSNEDVATFSESLGLGKDIIVLVCLNLFKMIIILPDVKICDICDKGSYIQSASYI